MSTWGSTLSVVPRIVAVAAALSASTANAQGTTPYVVIDLGTLGGSGSYTRAMNDSGQVVGGSDMADGSRHAFFWTQSGGMVDLGTLGGDSSAGLVVNDSGQVVGHSYTTGGLLRAFSWTQSGGMVDLGTLGGTYIYASAVNDSGQVVGVSSTAADVEHAFSWTQAEGMVDLRSLCPRDATYCRKQGCRDGTYCSSSADAVNQSGQVAGQSTIDAWGGAYHATLWLQNNPPVAVITPPPAFECARGTFVTLDGSPSYDPDGDPLSYTWWRGEPDVGPIVGTAARIEISADFVGSRTYTLVVDDGRSTASDLVVVNGVDTIPPSLSVSLSPPVLWPPDHRLVPIEAVVTASDACKPVTTSRLSITSNEPADGLGDGNTEIDIQGDSDAFSLRAERSGLGPGRVYTATYRAREIGEGGKTTVATATVVVPHNVP